MLKWLKNLLRDEKDVLVFHEKTKLTDDEIAIIKSFYKERSKNIKDIIRRLTINTEIIRIKYEELLGADINWKTLENVDNEAYNRKVRTTLSALRGRVEDIIKLTEELDSQIEVSLLSAVIKNYLEETIFKQFPQIRTATRLRLIK